jgi:photosystem II stability/assembly factor-like uncharacterized protein
MKNKILLLSVLGVSFCNIHLQAQKVNASMFSIMQARALGPGTMSGRITAIEGVLPDNGKTIYVGTAGGGVWKSTNAGTSYNAIFDKYCQSIGAIGLDPQNAKVLYVGTGESNMRNSVSIGNGMYKSTDAGANWTKIGLDSTEHISRIIVHPTNDKVVYAAAPGPLWSASKHRGLYKSEDAGATWKNILFKNENTGCAEILMDPKDPNILYASMWEFRRQPYSFNSGGAGSGLYKSMDGGKTWNELNNGLPAKPFGRIAMNIAPTNSQKLIAIVESNATGLYISNDAGATWKSQSATMNITARPFYFSTIQFHPINDKKVYRPAFDFAYSEDGGYSYSNASTDGGWVHSDHHALWINPKGNNIMYLGTDGGIYTSIDQGVTWIFNQSLPIGQFYHVDADNAEPYNVYGGLQDNGSWMAPNSAPGGVGNAHWNNLFGGDGFWTIADADNKTVYAEYQGGNMYRIDKATLKANYIQPQKTIAEEKLRWNWNTPIVLGAKNKNNLYTAAQYLYKSTNQGRSWTRISPDLTTNDKAKQKQENSGGLSADNTSAENHCTIFTIAESPSNENIIWVGTDDGQVQVTTNAGKSYTNVSANIAKSGIAKNAWISSIEPSHFNENTVYVTLENHMYGDHNTYLAKSNDLGKTWERMDSKEFTGFAHKVVEDLQNKDLLFVGTEMGLFATVDGGANWFRMKNNIPEYALVRDLKIHPKTHDLIIATHGRGIYVLDDIRFLRNVNKEILEKDVHLFATAPLLLSNGKFGYGGPQVSGGWGSGNAPEQPSITYYLKDRQNSGTASIDIKDANGKLVQSIPGTIRKGINKVDWNLRGLPPRVASGSAKADNTGFLAPMVLPGNYTATLNLNNKTYTSPIICLHDSTNTDLTKADRSLVFEKAMTLFKLYENVNNTVDTVSKYQALIKTDTVAFKKNKAAQTLYNNLENVRAELMSTKQKSIFADEEKLREKVSKLYSTFCTMEAKPDQSQILAIADLQKDLDTQNAMLEKVMVGVRRFIKQ